jgi:hypothetical protein
MIDWLRREQLALGGVCFNAAAERMNRVDELIDIFEMPMHRGVAEVRHFIDIA